MPTATDFHAVHESEIDSIAGELTVLLDIIGPVIHTTYKHKLELQRDRIVRLKDNPKVELPWTS